MFADGAAIGNPHFSMSASVNEFRGILTAAVSSPPHVSAGTWGLRGNIIVRGPGQKFSASVRASGRTLTAMSFNISVELMRAINFYRFSNPDSHLGDLWLCGGGAIISPLRMAMENNLDVKLHPASELVGDESIENSRTFVQAIGIATE